MMILPAIDLLEGRCVRLQRGSFDHVTYYRDDPLTVAQEFAASGATFLHVVDLEASRTGNRTSLSLIRRLVAESGLKVQLGGGIRRREDAKELLDLGVARVVIGSLAAKSPEVIVDLLDSYGPEPIVLALDLHLALDGQHQIAVEGWTKVAPIAYVDLLLRYHRAGGRQVLCTDIARDGVMSGPSLKLYQDLQRQFPSFNIIASGGVADLKDLQDLKSIDVYAVVVGRALYEGRFSLREALQC